MIDRFDGKFKFLRNDYPCNVLFEEEVYPSGEHAFQAAKTKDVETRKKIQLASLHDARKIGKSLKLDDFDDWNDSKYEIMKTIQTSKFNEPSLQMMLLLTGDELIIQGGMKKDLFWGQDEFGNGNNNMGKILMEVREILKLKFKSPWDVFVNEMKKTSVFNDKVIQYVINDGDLIFSFDE